MVAAAAHHGRGRIDGALPPRACGIDSRKCGAGASNGPRAASSNPADEARIAKLEAALAQVTALLKQATAGAGVRPAVAPARACRLQLLLLLLLRLPSRRHRQTCPKNLPRSMRRAAGLEPALSGSARSAQGADSRLHPERPLHGHDGQPAPHAHAERPHGFARHAQLPQDHRAHPAGAHGS